VPWHVDDNHPDCSGYAVIKDSDGSMAGCHKTREEANKQMAALYANESSDRAQMSASSINDLPDSAFAYIEPGGSKDESGKTVPRSKRHFPIHDAAHVRNALARAPQSPFGAKAMPKIKAAARRFGIQIADEKSQVPADNLVRSRMGDDVVQLRDSGVEGRTLFGHFAVFNQWAEINSVREGHFLEQIAPGAFTRSFGDNRYRIKVLYDHGKDPQLGNKPLGKLQELREDDDGGYYEVELIDTPYNDDFVIPAARAGLLGASFRFSVPPGGDKYDQRPKRSDRNPQGLPERTITDVDLFELGPVTWPAYEGATAGVRSGTDEFIDSLMHDPVFLARFIDRAGLTVVERVLDGLPPTEQDDDTSTQEVHDNDDLPPTAQDTERDLEVPESDDSPDGQPPIPTIPASTPAERRALVRQIELHRLGLRHKE
jgi:HK97 family phage prohead protease